MRSCYGRARSRRPRTEWHPVGRRTGSRIRPSNIRCRSMPRASNCLSRRRRRSGRCRRRMAKRSRWRIRRPRPRRCTYPGRAGRPALAGPASLTLRPPAAMAAATASRVRYMTLSLVNPVSRLPVRLGTISPPYSVFCRFAPRARRSKASTITGSHRLVVRRDSRGADSVCGPDQEAMLTCAGRIKSKPRNRNAETLCGAMV